MIARCPPLGRTPARRATSWYPPPPAARRRGSSCPPPWRPRRARGCARSHGPSPVPGRKGAPARDDTPTRPPVPHPASRGRWPSAPAARRSRAKRPRSAGSRDFVSPHRPARARPAWTLRALDRPGPRCWPGRQPADHRSCRRCRARCSRPNRPTSGARPTGAPPRAGPFGAAGAPRHLGHRAAGPGPGPRAPNRIARPRRGGPRAGDRRPLRGGPPPASDGSLRPRGPSPAREASRSPAG